MTNIIPISSEQNIYEKSLSYKPIAQVKVVFEGRELQKLTYRDKGSLCCKISQVAQMALITLATLFFILVSPRVREYWKETIDRFKDRVVYQIPDSPQAISTPTILSVKPISVAPVIAPPLPLNPITPALPFDKEIDKILKENPEYANAVKEWNVKNVPVADQLLRLKEMREYAFGTDKWVKYFGEIVGGVPPLPDDIHQILNSKEHTSNILIKVSHVLVLVPEKIMKDGVVPITPQTLGELAKNPNGGGHQACYNFGDEPRGANVHLLARSHWVLMKKFTIADGLTFGAQVRALDEYRIRANAPYNLPSLRDAVACNFLTYVDKKKMLSLVGLPWPTYTRCQEASGQNSHINVGVDKFGTSSALTVTGLRDDDTSYVGVAPAWVL